MVPEGKVQVKLMQQGQTLDAPVEIRIYGEDVNTLKQLGNDVKEILDQAQGSFFVHDNFKEDYYGISIKLNDQATRLGFTTSSIAQAIYVSTTGAVVSTMYEGDNAIDIVLRMKESKRQTTESLQDIYVESPVTGASVPLRQVAGFIPQWQTGRVVHRNGVRCLTVGSETTGGVLAADLLNEIRPKIDKIQVPSGYRIEYGGEYANKSEVFGQMILALGISLILIFLILMFQFKNLKEAVIIMCTIPLSMFGAIFGLAITGNNFGFTSFLGLISLSGIVVRNAIILIDHTNELLAEGMDIRTAAIDAAKRRLRPIFLTAMAAAIGVVPMIISGSSLWSPLASVIAFGVIWSMLMALLVIPVIYIVVIKPKDKLQLYDEQKNEKALVLKR